MASADLANLIALNGSQESVHSFHSTQSNQASVDAQLAADLHTAALHKGSVDFQAVDDFLNDPSNKALLTASSAPKRQKTSTGKARLPHASGSSAGEPVQLGAPRTSHYVPLLYQESAQRGYNPEFEYESDESGFGGSVTVNGQTFSSDLRWQSKKEAKEGLSEIAIPFVKAMEHRHKPVSGPQENWIGKLLEYHSAVSPSQGPVYTEYILPGPTFACTCVIPSTVSSFGSQEIAFRSKKAARLNAAREAMQHLIAQGLTDSDGSLRGKKKAKLGTAIRIEANDLGARKNITYSQKVNDLSKELGLGQPFYQLGSQPEAPTLFSGAAHYTSTPLFPKPLGVIRNVHGKKNAKEECARGVWEVLKDLAKKRGLDVEDVPGDEDVAMGT